MTQWFYHQIVLRCELRIGKSRSFTFVSPIVKLLLQRSFYIPQGLQDYASVLGLFTFELQKKIGQSARNLISRALQRRKSEDLYQSFKRRYALILATRQLLPIHEFHICNAVAFLDFIFLASFPFPFFPLSFLFSKCLFHIYS